MSTPDIAVTRQGGVTQLRFNRPAKRNAITVAMYAALADALVAAETDGTTVVIFSGAGPGFTAGNDLADFVAAGLTNDIVEWQIPVGATMPFMSTREAGRPLCLRNVTWAGQEPIQAYAFLFTSKGERYRCVTPKPCSARR